MFILILFAFLGGIVTILSPCILPILPIVLSGSLTGGKRRPFGIVTGFIVSFTFFTLFLTTLVKLLGLSADFLRSLAVVVVFTFGLSLLVPQMQILMEQLFSKLTPLASKNSQKEGFGGGLLVGVSLGLVWTPCVGPILAAIITLAATSSVTLSAVFITLAYSTGTAIPLLAITYGGRQLLTAHPWLLTNSARIQKAFGTLMLLTALSIYLNLDRRFQAWIITKFPQYGVGLTRLEDSEVVKKALEKFQKEPMDETKRGQPMFNFLKTDLGEAPEFILGGQWFNSPPLTVVELKGKVVLVDFWTYTCINCIRTLPYLRSWHEKYADKGLVIVGVHTPEFEFEKNANNVAKAITDFELKYPIMQDNDFATWNAYHNRYWPAKYLIDKNGRIRYTHFGEGKYDETEKVIQELLTEMGETIDEPVANPTYQISARTPELYFGTLRYQPGYITFSGLWKEFPEYRTGTPPTASLTLNFEAKDVYLVMGPDRSLGKIQLELDNQPVPMTSSGKDVTSSQVEVVSQRAYHLISLPQPGKHTLTVKVIDVFSVEFYAFTFG